MPAIASWKVSTILGFLARTSSATVAADKTFDPEGFVSPGVARYVDRSGGIPAGFPSISLSIRKPTKQSRLYKVLAKLAIPRMSATSTSTNTGIEPAPDVAYTCQANMEFLIPERATAAERALFLSEVMSMFMTTINASDDVPTDATGSPLAAVILNLEAPY
jgi:hypothetical protein